MDSEQNVGMTQAELPAVILSRPQFLVSKMSRMFHIPSLPACSGVVYTRIIPKKGRNNHFFLVPKIQRALFSSGMFARSVPLLLFSYLADA